MRYHAPSGLYLTPYRAYDPKLGRWLSQDPIGEAGGLNLYGYVGCNPLSDIDPLGLFTLPLLPQWMVDSSAGFGDSMSFGITRGLRNVFNIGGTDKCSSAYRAGEAGAIAFSLAFGGAHLGRNALNQMGSGGFRQGLGRLFSDPRGWNNVRRTWSHAAGGGNPWLQAHGQSLHHWLIPQRVLKRYPALANRLEPIINAGFNYLPTTASFNSWMNNSTYLRGAVEWGFRLSVLGIYGAPATVGIHETVGGGSECSCN